MKNFFKVLKKEQNTSIQKSWMIILMNSVLSPIPPSTTRYLHSRDGLRRVQTKLQALMRNMAYVTKTSWNTSVILFGQKSEVFASDKDGNDNNTPPSMTNAVRLEQYFGAMALSTVFDQVMLDDSASCVVYSNYGSSQSVTGSYVVQPLTVNGVQRSLATFSILKETRYSLK